MAEAWLQQFVQDTVDNALRLLSTGQALNSCKLHPWHPFKFPQPLKLAGSPIRIIFCPGANVQVAPQYGAVPRMAMICGVERSGLLSALFCVAAPMTVQTLTSWSWLNFSGMGKLKMHEVNYGCWGDGSIDNPGGKPCLNHFRTLLELTTLVAKLRAWFI